MSCNWEGVNIDLLELFGQSGQEVKVNKITAGHRLPGRLDARASREINGQAGRARYNHGWPAVTAACHSS